MQHNFIGVIELCGRKRRILLHPVLIIALFYCLVHNIATNTADLTPSTVFYCQRVGRFRASNAIKDNVNTQYIYWIYGK